MAKKKEEPKTTCSRCGRSVAAAGTLTDEQGRVVARHICLDCVAEIQKGKKNGN